MPRSLTLSWMLSISMATASAFAVSFHPLGNPPGALKSHACAVSADGTTVVGQAGWIHEAFRYQSGQMVTLDGLGGYPYDSEAHGVSGDGSIIVGWSSTVDGTRACAWQNGTVTRLGDLPGGSGQSRALAISANGAVIVGRASTTSGTVAFRRVNGTMLPLGDLPEGTTHSIGYGVSANGSVIVGEANSASGTEAFRWENDVMVGLGDLPGGTFASTAYAVSADGSVVVGSANSDRGYEAFRWQDSVMSPLGTASGETFHVARAVSADGSVIVGEGSSSLGGEAFIWDATHGARTLRSALINEYGLDMTGWRLYEATGISADGLTIVGTAGSPDGDVQPYMVVIPEPATAALLTVGGLVLLRGKR